MKTNIPITIALIIMTMSASISLAQDDAYFISTSELTSFSGITFDDDEVITYHPKDKSLSLFLCDALFEYDHGIDALHVKDNGKLILSSKSAGRIGNLDFTPGDLIEYNPATGSAKIFLSHKLFSEHANICAVFIRDNGNVVLSMTDDVILSETLFSAGDLIEYNPQKQTAWILLDHQQFVPTVSIDAVYIRNNGNIILSTDHDTMLCNVNFKAGELVEYNPNTDKADILLKQSNFIDKAVNIDAIHVGTDINLAYGGMASSGSSDGNAYSSVSAMPNEWSPYAPPLAPVNFPGRPFKTYPEISSPHPESNQNDEVATIPEPATAMLLVLGFFTIFIRRHRQHGI